jgi:UDP-N-acetylmuramate--alanine ligase
VEPWRLCEGITAHGHKHVICVDDFSHGVAQLSEILKPGDVLLTLGAGDVWKVGEMILQVNDLEEKRNT